MRSHALWRVLTFAAAILLFTNARVHAQTSEDEKWTQEEMQLLELAQKTPVAKILELLDEEVDTRPFPRQSTVLEFLKLLQKDLLHRKKLVRIVVDWEAFEKERRDAPGTGGRLVSPQDWPERMRLATILTITAGRLPGFNAAFRYRRGHVEITTAEKAHFHCYLETPISGVFTNRPLTQVLDELSETSGVTIIVDMRVKKQAEKKKITAKFKNYVSLETALKIVTDMTELRYVVIDNAVYVTSPENARKLEKEIEKKKHDAPKQLLPGGGI